MRVESFADPTSWADIQKQAAAAEAAGFDAFSTPEIKNDPFQTLTAAALATETIQLRTAILVAFPRSPMVTAGSAWEVHENSGGRLVLGLGTQVKGHNERRFSVPWPAKPATKLREYIEAMRAIWSAWQHGKRLTYEGEYYQFSLMTPEFAHAPNDFAPIPVYTAAVRPAMLRLAGRVADGVRLHGFCTRKYLEEVAMPALQEGMTKSGRERTNFEICGGGFTATGPDEEAVQKMFEIIRYRISFYGSTRTYLPVFQLHGWDDLAAKLHTMSKTGKWKSMAAEVPDEVVHEFAAVATYDNLAPAIAKRFGGMSDAVELGFLPETAPELMREVISDMQHIPSTFDKHLGWSERS